MTHAHVVCTNMEPAGHWARPHCAECGEPVPQAQLDAHLAFASVVLAFMHGLPVDEAREIYGDEIAEALMAAREFGIG